MAKKGQALKPAIAKLTARPSLRCKQAELEAWREAAFTEGSTFNEAIRDALNAWAQRVLKRKGK